MGNRIPPNFLTAQKLATDAQQIAVGHHSFGAFAPAGIFSTDAHNNLIRTKGHKATHWRHALNPARKTVEAGVSLNTPTDSGAMLLYDAREFYVAIQSISWNDQYIMQGIHGSNTIQSVNYTTYYEIPEQTQRVYLRKFDIIKINTGHTVMVSELVEYKPNGPSKLKFPIVDIEYLVDSQKTRYEQGTDFQITSGMLEWIGTRRPLWDAQNSRGAVLSINYFAEPYYSVLETPRAFREVSTNSLGNAALPAEATYISGQAVLKALWLDDGFVTDLPDWPRYQEPTRTPNTRS